MSWHGRLVVERMDELLALAERRWWERYAAALTPTERRRISRGDYRAFFRPYVPEFGPGHWLAAAPKLKVRIGSVELKRGRFRCVIDRVQDFRPPTSLSPRPRRLHEDPELMETTIAVVGRPDPPEPERVCEQQLTVGTSSELARQRYAAVQAEARQQHQALPLGQRLAAIQGAAKASHMDISSDVRVLERQVARLERKVMER